MAAHPSADVLLVPWIYSRLGTDEWKFSPSALYLEFNISLVEMLIELVSQHVLVFIALLKQPILWSNDLKVKSSYTIFGMEAYIAVIFLPLWEELPYRWRNAVSWKNGWLKPLVVPLNSSFLVHKEIILPSTQQVGAWSSTCVQSIVDFLLALRYLLFLMDLLHYQITLMCLFVAPVWCYPSLENYQFLDSIVIQALSWNLLLWRLDDW